MTRGGRQGWRGESGIAWDVQVVGGAGVCIQASAFRDVTNGIGCACACACASACACGGGGGWKARKNVWVGRKVPGGLPDRCCDRVQALQVDVTAMHGAVVGVVGYSAVLCAWFLVATLLNAL